LKNKITSQLVLALPEEKENSKSKIMQVAKINYEIYDKELLAIVEALTR